MTVGQTVDLRIDKEFRALIPASKLELHTATVGQLGRWIAHFLWKEVPPF